MKRYGWIAGALLIAALLVAAEMAVISNATSRNVKEKAVFARVKIDKDTVIEKNMLELREISSEAVHPEALKDIDAALSKAASMNIEAGELLLKAKLSSEINGIIEAEDKNNRLFSVEFEGDQANGWQLAEGQLVDIIYVPHDNKKNQPAQSGESVVGSITGDQVEILRNIRIAGIIDENGKLVDITETKGTPRYISFEVTSEQAAFLAYAKKNGQLEISSIPG